MMKRFTNLSNGSQAGRMYNGGAIIRRFALFPLMLLMLLLLPAGMVAQKAASSSKYIATYESSTQTLTFKENVGETLPENSAWVKDKQTVATINKNLGNGTIVHIVFDKSFSTYTPTSLRRFFEDLTKLETITGLEYLNTENVTDMGHMFYSCSSLTSLDVTHFNTENVTDMSYMFSDCSSLTSLDVTHFNTAKVTDMIAMFYSCSSLTSLDVTHFNTENVTKMYSMFYSCSSLTSLDVTHFNTAKVTNMIYMFYNCSSLTSLDVTHFNTANVKVMSYMFSSCSSLTSLDVTHFNTANVMKMNGMFSYSVALTSLYLTNFNTEKVTNMEDMFSGCQALTTIYASSKFVTTQVTKSSGMFNKCEKLKGEEEWKNDKATDKTYAKIEGGYFSRAIPRVKYADGTLTFFLASKETLGENEYELNSGKNLPEWVKHTFSITKVVFDTSFANARPTSCYKWFFWCEKLNQVEGIKNLNTKEVTDMADMFYECRDLSSLDVSGFNTEKVTDMSGMFYECISLKLLDVAKFNTANVKSMSNMFYRCYNLDLLNVTNFNTANVTNMQGMFYSCPALTTIYASDKFVTGQVTDGSNMFSNCINLKGFIEYNKNTDKNNSEFANYKTGYFTKLVGKNGDEKIGATGEPLATENLALADDKDFVAYEPFAAKAASYNRTMNAGTTWATLCLPFAIVQSQETECKFYCLTGIDNDCITLESYEEGAEIPAGTPVLFKMNEGEQTLSISAQDASIVTEPKAGTNTDVNLVGSFTKIGGKDNQGLADTDYIIGKDKFWRVSGLNDGKGVGIKPMRAYIHPATASQARAAMLSIGKGDGTTVIDNLNAISNDANAEYYDANGRRTNGLQKGLNIVKRGSKTYKIMVK
jgi:surface protein